MRDTAHPSCFVALLPDVDGIDVDSLCAIPADTGVGFNWFVSSYLHLTLAYLGWLRGTERERVADTVTRVLRERAALDSAVPSSIVLDGTLAVVGPPDRRSLRAPVRTSPELNDLREALARALGDAGHGPCEPFRPHVTVARVSPGELPDTSGWSIAPVRWPVRSVLLLEGHTVFREPQAPTHGFAGGMT